MSRSAVARNYAATLFELASGEEERERYGQLLAEFAEVYRSTPAVRAFLDTPRVSLDDKRKAVRETVGSGAPEYFTRFLLVVLERRRQRAIPAVAEAYQELLDEAAGRIHATVHVPFEADAAVRSRITDALSQRVGRQVVADFEVDPKLLGGFVARVGDQLVDASLKRKLDRMKWELA